MTDSLLRSPLAMWRGSIVAALSLVLAADARAQNASTPGVLELYPTLQCIGARLHYTGDLDSDATAHLEWRGQGGVWTRGVEMSRIANSRWAGSVLWLQPGLPYEVRAVIDDPDGGGSSTASVTTRREPITAPTYFPHCRLSVRGKGSDAGIVIRVVGGQTLESTVNPQVLGGHAPHLDVREAAAPVADCVAVWKIPTQVSFRACSAPRTVRSAEMSGLNRTPMRWTSQRN